MTLFSHSTAQLHFARAQKNFPEHDFLFQHIGEELLQRAQSCQRTFTKRLNISPHRLASFKGENHCSFTEDFMGIENTYDLIISCLYAHWINDLPTFLVNIFRCLQQGGVFLGALWAGSTLLELRESLLQAELLLKGGASPRVAPMLQPFDAPRLLERAGFLNPVVDTEIFTVEYDSIFSLMKDLRGMGETNKVQDRLKVFTPSRLFDKAQEIYQKNYGADGKLPATFEVVYVTGWK